MLKLDLLPNNIYWAKVKEWNKKSKIALSTSSLTIPSFKGDPTIFHKGIFLKQTPHIKN